MRLGPSLRSLAQRVLVAVVVLVGCRPAEDPERAATRDDERGAAAADGAMCQEHGVLEAVCTKCNPKLAAVFQAKGDWCEEHGFPESFCPTCHPERGGRPGAEVKAERAPADGLRIRFKRSDTAKLAGIQIVTASERPTGTAIAAPVRFAYDATKVALVNARSAGVIKVLEVDVGSQVTAGQALAIMHSPEVGADRARLTAAKSRLAVAEENFARQEQLHREGIGARKNVLAAQQELDTARSEHAAIAASLSLLGRRKGRGGHAIEAPLAGVVTQRKATVGQVVDSEDMLFEIVDTSAMWAEIDVAEGDLPSIAVGQTVTMHVDGLGDRELSGSITYVAPIIDPHTRTAVARVPVANPEGLVRANMYGQAKIAAGASRSSVALPRAAIQRAGDVHLAFVRITNDEYETRRVKLGIADAEAIEILAGVRAGEEVVTTGSFLLKTETLKSSIGAGCCEGE